MPALFPSTYKQVVKNMQDILDQLAILNSINDKVNSYDTKFDEINSNFTTINQSFEKINTELVTINDSIEKLGDLTDFPYGSITELAEKVEELEDKLLKHTEPGTASGDVVNTDNGIKVVGVHVNTTNVTENTTINNYTQGITYEIKSTEAIDLKGKPGVSGAYCMLVTFKQDATLTGESTVTEFVPFQIAYGTDGMVMYKRTANSTDNTWSEWVTTEQVKPRTQVIETDDNNQPADDVQIAGEYWMENLT